MDVHTTYNFPSVTVSDLHELLQLAKRHPNDNHGATCVLFQWQKDHGSSSHTKIYEGDRKNTVMEALRMQLGKHRPR